MTLVLGALFLYVTTLQAQLHKDGIIFMARLENGQLLYPHQLYLPTAQLLHWLISLFAPVSIETSLKLLSAVSAAVTLPLVFVAARTILRTVTGHGDGAALIAATTLALLPGYWICATASAVHSLHTLCAMLLFLGLLLALGPPRRLGTGPRVLQFLGALLTPASHASGVCAVLPAAYAARNSSTPWGTAGWLGLGFAIPLLTYPALLYFSNLPATYTSTIADHYLALFLEPGRLASFLQHSCTEFLLYSAPVATLAPLGLRLLFLRAPRWAWLCTLWLLAWPLIAFPIATWDMGAYYLPTFPVQSLLAVLGFLSLARNAVAAITVACVAVLPGIALSSGQSLGLLTYMICAAGLFLTPSIRGTNTARPVWLITLPIAALLLTAIVYEPSFDDDPLRDLIHDMNRRSSPDAHIVILEANHASNGQWSHFVEPRRQLINPPIAGQRDADEAALQRYEQLVATQLQDDREVWLVGNLRGWSENRFTSDFLRHVRSNYDLVTPRGAPRGVRRLRLRTQIESLPEGTTSYGVSTHGCDGALPIGALSVPRIGNGDFALTCERAPAEGPGILVLSGGRQTTPVLLHGVEVWLALDSPLFSHTQVLSDSRGEVEVPFPIPANPNLVGFQVFVQFAWLDACAPVGVSSSNALAITVW